MGCRTQSAIVHIAYILQKWLFCGGKIVLAFTGNNIKPRTAKKTTQSYRKKQNHTNGLFLYMSYTFHTPRWGDLRFSFVGFEMGLGHHLVTIRLF